MELFKIAEGPWEKLFSGVFHEHEVEIYINPKKIVMALIYEKKLDIVEGAIIELYKVFYAEGETDSFTETLPREVLVILKHEENKNLKFLMLGSKPTYVRWVEDEFVKEVDSMVKRVDTSSEMIKDISKAYELTLKEISDCPEEIKMAFFTQPMLIPIITTSSHVEAGTSMQSLSSRIKSDVILGLTKDKKKIVEPLGLFSSTIVTDGEEKDRERVMQVLAESSMLANVPVIIFDFSGRFAWLGEASKDIAELKKYEVEIDPIGFPTRFLKPKEIVKVDLNIIDYEAISGIFGIGDKEFARICNLAASSGQVNSIDEFIQKITNIKSNEEFTEFEINKAARIIKLIEVMHPGFFGGSIDVEEMTRPGTSNIARASIIDMQNLDSKINTLIFYSVLKSVFKYFSLKGESKAMRAMVIMPKATIIDDSERKKTIAEEISSIFSKMNDKGIGFVLGSQQQIEIDPTIKSITEAKINVVSGNDVGVQLKNAKAYRVLVRPTLSKRSI
jgi:hypothetical protein